MRVAVAVREIAVARAPSGSDVPERFALARRRASSALRRGRADAARRRVDDPQQRDLVGGFASTFRYARRSRTSLRSKNDMPPTSTYGTSARRSSVSNARGCSLVRNRIAKSLGTGACRRAAQALLDVAHDAFGFLRFVLEAQDARRRRRRSRVGRSTLSWRVPLCAMSVLASSRIGAAER